MRGISPQKLTDPKRRKTAARKSAATNATRSYVPIDPSASIDQLRAQIRAACYQPLDGIIGEAIAAHGGRSALEPPQNLRRRSVILTEEESHDDDSGEA